MATPATPQTPAAQTPHSYATPGGTWKHPQFDEITRRQYATTFDERNVRAIVANAGLLFMTMCANEVASKVKLVGYAVAPVNALLSRTPYSVWAVVLVRLVLAANIVIAFAPLVRRYYPDDIADIPLTPSQRTSMGLRADVASPATPGSVLASPSYVTPPRYQRSTPRSSFSNHSERPLHLSGSPRPALGRSTSNGSFSQSNGSATKRLSYGGSSSPFNASVFSDSAAGPGTPTPAGGKASVGLNNKWLYEKRRDSRSSMFH